MLTIDVVFTCDKNFFEYLTVAIDSLMRSMKRENLAKLVVHVIQIDFSQEQKKRLHKIFSNQSSDAELKFYDYEIQNKFSRCQYKAVEIVTLVYYLPDFLVDIDRVIFIDADTMFLEDITDLWELDLGDHWIATTPCVLDDESLQEYGWNTQGRYWSAEQTINAGIMVLDLAKMRTLGVTRQLEIWTEKYQDKLKLPEQEAIAFNYPIRKLIDHKWNWRGALKYAEMHWSARSNTQLFAYAKIRPSMVHLQNPCRPLDTVINSKYFAMWIKYYENLGMSLPERKKLKFSMFLFLMVEDKSKFHNLNKFAFRRRHFALWIKCIFAYRRYCNDPEQFVFPTIEAA